MTDRTTPNGPRTGARLARRMMVMLVIVLVIFGGLFGMQWFGTRMMNSAIDSMPIPPATVSAAPVQPMSWPNELRAIGSFVAVAGTEVTTEVGGIVTAIHFESGAPVEAGALLVNLDAATERADHRKLLARAELAELNRKRRKQLLDRRQIAAADYDTAVSEARAARAEAEAQAAKTAQKEIRAPFTGVLGLRQAHIGQYLTPGSPIVSLQALDPIDLDFALPEQHTGAVQPGYPVRVRVAAYPAAEFSGEVLALEPRIDAATRNFRLRARLPNPEGRLRAGQFGDVSLRLPGTRELLAIPRTAVRYDSYGTSVFVIQAAPGQRAPAGTEGATAPPGRVAAQRFIQVGEARGDWIAVIGGIRKDELVATAGLLKLRNGQPVIVNNAVVPAAELDPDPPEG